jgi:hypothetical protein
MRFESCVTSISWIPSEAVEGVVQLPFEMHVGHYDLPPPDLIDDLEALRAADRFRFANQLRAWIEVEDGRIVDSGYSGGAVMGATHVRIGPLPVTFAATAFPTIQSEPEIAGDHARFVQTAGGRPGMPLPRRVNHPPFVQLAGPTVWTTLGLTIFANGIATYELIGASPFPRHWIYDDSGALAAKSGTVDFGEWYRHAFGKHSPWGDEDSPALMTVAETALERQLSTTIMRGGKRPKIRELKEGRTLVEQGQPGEELYLLLDGVLAVEVNGEQLAELGPGAILGERAVLEGGTRTATLRATTPVKVAVASADDVDREALAEISEGHRREERPGSP